MTTITGKGIDNGENKPKTFPIMILNKKSEVIFKDMICGSKEDAERILAKELSKLQKTL